MTEGYDLITPIKNFNQIINDLLRLGVRFEDDNRTLILLCSLQNTFKHLVTTLKK